MAEDHTACVLRWSLGDRPGGKNVVNDSDCSLRLASELPEEHLRDFPGSSPTAESVSV